jgi:3-hydroxy-3-methylglutaryl CoA synthase
MWFGDGAAALMVGDTDVIAEFEGAYTVSYDFVDHYRAAGKNLTTSGRSAGSGTRATAR